MRTRTHYELTSLDLQKRRSAVANPEEGAILVLDLARILDAGRALASEQT